MLVLRFRDRVTKCEDGEWREPKPHHRRIGLVIKVRHTLAGFNLTQQDPAAANSAGLVNSAATTDPLGTPTMT
jgi:hypothetical protein